MFRHGNCLNSDYDSERLSEEGIKQAQGAGKIAGKILNERLLCLQKNSGVDVRELQGVLKLHSGMPRAYKFLEKLFESTRELDNSGLLTGNS